MGLLDPLVLLLPLDYHWLRYWTYWPWATWVHALLAALIHNWLPAWVHTWLPAWVPTWLDHCWSRYVGDRTDSLVTGILICRAH